MRGAAPAPLGPSSPKRSPAGTPRHRSCTATCTSTDASQGALARPEHSMAIEEEAKVPAWLISGSACPQNLCNYYSAHPEHAKAACKLVWRSTIAPSVAPWEGRLRRLCAGCAGTGCRLQHRRSSRAPSLQPHPRPLPQPLPPLQPAHSRQQLSKHRKNIAITEHLGSLPASCVCYSIPEYSWNAPAVKEFAER